MKFRNLLAASCVAVCTAASAHAQSPVVTTEYGEVQGTTANGINSFKGIPYALPPVGALRWAPPQNPLPFNGVFQATSFGLQCAQPVSQFGTAGTSEDCLYLNVLAPASATGSSKLPVMIWIHGGAFIVGEGWDYDGTALIQSGNVVVVTLNYRLGLFGFLTHPALAANGIEGNYGLLDQQAAIAWVRQNIAGFGGDPRNMTIFGESAGGQSVLDQIVSPSVGPIQKAIVESGAYAGSLPTLSQAEKTGEQRMGALGCPMPTTAACLRGLTTEQILSAVNPLTDTGVISPVVDGKVLPMQPFQALNSGNFQHVPLMDGSNHDEWRLFVILNEVLGGPPVTSQNFAPTVIGQYGQALGRAVIAEYPLGTYPGANYDDAALVTDSGFSCGAHLLNALAAQYTSVYAYELNDPNAPDLFLPYDPNMPNAGDSHAAELPYLWPTLQSPLFGKGPAQFTPAQQNLASGMRASWTSFARFGRPLNNRGGLWPRYTTATDTVESLISPSPRVITNFVTDHNCEFWKSYLLSGAGLPPTVPY